MSASTGVLYQQITIGTGYPATRSYLIPAASIAGVGFVVEQLLQLVGIIGGAVAADYILWSCSLIANDSSTNAGPVALTLISIKLLTPGYEVGTNYRIGGQSAGSGTQTNKLAVIFGNRNKVAQSTIIMMRITIVFYSTSKVIICRLI